MFQHSNRNTSSQLPHHRADKSIIMLKFIAITLLLGVASAAPSGSNLFLTRLAEAPIAFAPAPITYAEPTTLTKYESISSPLTYTASHQPAVALTNSYPLAPLAPLAYTNYAGYPIRYNALGFAY